MAYRLQKLPVPDKQDSEMNIDYTAALGLIAGTLTTASLLPQVIKTLKTKETRDLSLSMFVILAAGMFLWTVYGILIAAVPVILANAISFLLTTAIIVFKLKYG